MPLWQRQKVQALPRRAVDMGVHNDNPTGVMFKQNNCTINVGRFTYGYERTTFREYGESVTVNIGNFCSIAENVTVLLGGNHRFDWAANWHFGFYYIAQLGGADIKEPSYSNGAVNIGHDVWIGRGATILSGVTIGNGAVIAANAHVVKDVAPYEMVGGNPAKHIKFRFSQDIIDLLDQLHWWDLPDATVRDIAKDLSQVPTAEILKSLIERTKG
jgi:acetyltransferase-like isoleucine patch superfamily enzyme